MICCICSQIAGDPANDLFAAAVGGSHYVRRVAFETANFAAIPSLGPLVPGHLLLCPKKHFRSFGALPAEYDAEFVDVLSKLTCLLREMYSPQVHLFEHGMAQKGTRVLCTVEHAHLHLVPTGVSIEPALNPYPYLSVPPGPDGLRSLVKDEEYVFYESPRGERRVIRSRDQQF
jgi:ATP adenylyltransferase